MARTTAINFYCCYDCYCWPSVRQILLLLVVIIITMTTAAAAAADLEFKAHFRASQVALVVKNPPPNAGDVRNTRSIPGSGRSPGGGHGNPLQYSCLENSMDRKAWRVIVHKITKSQIRRKQLSMHAWPLAYKHVLNASLYATCFIRIISHIFLQQLLEGGTIIVPALQMKEWRYKKVKIPAQSYTASGGRVEIQTQRAWLPSLST